MDQVIHADRCAVPVNGDDDLIQFGLGQFDYGGKGDRQDMCGMDGVEFQITGSP